MREIFVFCESAPEGMREVSFELLGEARRLAASLGARVTAVALGARVEEQAALGAAGADRVLLVEDASLSPATETRYTDEMAALCRKYAPEIVLFGATAFGRGLAPRVAARLETGITADCTSLEIGEDGLLRQTRPAFGGNLLATIVCPERLPQMATVRPKVFRRPEPDATRPFEVIREKSVGGGTGVEVLERLGGEGGVNLNDYEILVAVGQGIGGAENIAMAEELARRLGGTLAASRPLVDAGLLPYARQVGQTGRTVAPRLYLALGISGAVQHLAGIASGVVVAVNTDPDAPIFQHARYALTQDCGDFLREALTLVKRP